MLDFFEFLMVDDEVVKPPLTDVVAQGDLKSILIIGDSTMAAEACRTQAIASILFTSSEKTSGFTATSIAVPGHTIQQQLDTWNNYSNKNTHDAIVIQVGLNNCNPAANSIQSNRTSYQALINSINSGKKNGAKVIVSCMNPAKQRWYNVYPDPVGAQALWQQLNSDIMHYLSGVSKRNDYHVELLSDSNGNLAAQYDCGDHIHQNNDGALINRKTIRFTLYGY